MRTTYFDVFVFSKKHDFEVTILQRVTFWTKIFTACQIFNVIFFVSLSFTFKNIQLFHF